MPKGKQMMKAINLKTEYLSCPMALDIREPRFFWNCEGCVKQSAYRVAAKRNGETIWDTGKVCSGRMTHIRYAGQPLQSHDHIQWSVTLWDENDAEGEAVSSWFEMGLLNGGDWEAEAEARGEVYVSPEEKAAREQALLDKIAEEKRVKEYGAVWLDLNAGLADEAGNLDAKFTFDGLHLNAAGYRVVTDKIRPLLK
jgi:hypothetical protein